METYKCHVVIFLKNFNFDLGISDLELGIFNLWLFLNSNLGISIFNFDFPNFNVRNSNFKINFFNLNLEILNYKIRYSNFKVKIF